MPRPMPETAGEVTALSAGTSTKYSSKTTRWSYTTPMPRPMPETAGEMPAMSTGTSTTKSRALTTATWRPSAKTALKIMPPEKGGTKKSPNVTTSSRIKPSSNKTLTSGKKPTIINGRRPPSNVGEPTTLYSILATADRKTATIGNAATATTSPATTTIAETTSTTAETSSTAVQVDSSGESQQSIGGILNSFNNIVSNFLQRFSFG
jgi:hypothetical protein